ncbi:hypothetical protein CWI80_12290 [Pseudidiomarina sediminum]|uniref:Uncharacterized protein n=1 Tax=Pseudidiomarina sediminum TaxID=431675 RepID=A0A432YZF5_9GAMM|nr:hypothetical protein [Pseudidiomarina sediminum]RUO69002.1 hypothetical protein CWI80_12290 [Pseudidiomarina sediminum]
MPHSFIPFAIHVPSGRTIEVSEAERGSNCECICPVCFGDLVAKQGDVNEWHFAQHQASHAQTCYYVFAESLYTMAMQLAERIERIYVPSTRMIPNRTLDVTSVTTGVSFDGYAVDLVVITEQTQVAVVFTHALRPFRKELLSAIPNTYPILEIELNRNYDALKASEPGRYVECLLHLISTSWVDKYWRRSPENSEYPHQPQFAYHCLGCGGCWQSHAHDNMCKRCKSPLLSMRNPL